MPQILSFVFFAIGLLLIVKGSDFFLDAVIWCAKILHIPEVIMGATVVSICTTLPELTVSTALAAEGKADMALGNAYGAIAFNTGIILALSIIMLRPAMAERRSLKQNALLLFAGVALSFLSGYLFGEFSRIIGGIFIGIFLFYLIKNGFDAVKEAKEKEKAEGETAAIPKEKTDAGKKIFKHIVLFIVGVVGIFFGAQLMVEHGTKIAEILGIPEMIIALTMTAVGTSLPELFTTIPAIRKKKSDISIGGALGANTINLFLILGVASVVHPLPIEGAFLQRLLPLTALIIAVAFYPVFTKKERYPRLSGWLAFVGYLIYVAALFISDL